MTQSTLIGAQRDLFVRPLIHGLVPDDPFRVNLAPAAMNAVKLRNRDLAAALVSPIDYAREGSEYRIVPGIAVSSLATTGMAAIHFREGSRSMTSLAVDPSSSMEIILARIILAESFDVTPPIVPVSGPLETMLQKADAALLVGDHALRQDSSSTHSLDLIEEWMELTELPFVHALWCGREQSLTEQQILLLQEARDAGLAHLSDICATPEMAHAFAPFSPADLENYLGGFDYVLSDDCKASVKELLKFAYYHGILPDVPELHFYGDTEDDESPIP